APSAPLRRVRPDNRIRHIGFDESFARQWSPDHALCIYGCPNHRHACKRTACQRGGESGRPPVSDAVILWVDGADPQHRKKRAAFAAHAANAARHGNAPTRFADNTEIAYCIRSIRVYAPWIETIHVV